MAYKIIFNRPQFLLRFFIVSLPKLVIEFLYFRI
jgi:hypothetical protein